MKVSELYIKKYHQFEDFELNLTYPEGHPKAGKPLDKVCFIGQSGTGKTSLLNLLREFIVHLTYTFDNDDDFAMSFSQDYNDVRITVISENLLINTISFEDSDFLTPMSFYYQSMSIPEIWESFWDYNPNFKIFIYSSEMTFNRENLKKGEDKLDEDDTIIG